MKIQEFSHYGRVFEIHKLVTHEEGQCGIDYKSETWYGWLEKGDPYGEPRFEYKTEQECIRDIQRKF